MVVQKSVELLRSTQKMLRTLAESGILLTISAVFGFAAVNSPYEATYEHALHVTVAGLSIQHWINDGLMALFFLLVGLEIKREFVEGQLSTWRQRALPGIAALGGMVAPAIVFALITWGGGPATRGWAIPTATDIAFALGIVSLLGKRVPTELVVFLTALAVIDDLGAILLIATVYSGDLDLRALGAATAIVGALYAINRLGVRRLPIYLAIGAALWIAVFLSGIHATLAGILLACMIPIVQASERSHDEESPLHRLEHSFKDWVGLVILPIFALANAGVDVRDIVLADLAKPVTLGVAAGLFFGKQIGVLATTWIGIRLGLAQRPAGTTWLQFYGIAILCGVGFTMSLFLGALAFPAHPTTQGQAKLGTLLGSMLSAVLGAGVLLYATKRNRSVSD